MADTHAPVIASSPNLTPGQRMILAEELIEQARVCSDARPREACQLLREAQRQLGRAADELRGCRS